VAISRIKTLNELKTSVVELNIADQIELNNLNNQFPDYSNNEFHFLEFLTNKKIKKMALTDTEDFLLGLLNNSNDKKNVNNIKNVNLIDLNRSNSNTLEEPINNNTNNI